MPLKSKVKFTDNQSGKKGGGGNTAPNSPNNSDNVALQNASKSRKSRKASKVVNELLASTSEINDADYQFNEDGSTSGMQDGSRRKSRKSNALREIGSLVLMDCDKNVSDGSIDDEEVPEVEWPPPSPEEDGGKGGVCPVGGGGVGGGGAVNNTTDDNDGTADPAPALCSVGIRLTVSQKVTPCMKSDDQAFSTTDYSKNVSAAEGMLPNLIHPVNGQVSTFARHREFTNYLRTSGVLRLYGTCILSVYRMKTWPAPEKLMEQILNAMGYRMTTRTEVEELTELKQNLIDRLKDLMKQRCELMEKLDDYQDSGAKYTLLDQDEILPPRPENSKINMEKMTETFKQFEEDVPSSTSSPSPPSGNYQEEESADLKVTVFKKAPVSDALSIPEHDNRMLI